MEKGFVFDCRRLATQGCLALFLDLACHPGWNILLLFLSWACLFPPPRHCSYALEHIIVRAWLMRDKMQMLFGRVDDMVKVSVEFRQERVVPLPTVAPYYRLPSSKILYFLCFYVQ